MKQKPKRSLDKYAYGTSGVVKNYLPNPAEVLAEDKMNKAKAVYEGSSNPIALGLDAFAPLIGQMASGMFQPQSATGTPTETMANGGTVGDQTVEVEGDEVYETPGMEMGEFTGPSHEQGGITTELPEGTKIFSDRLKIGGKTMADRKLARESRMDRILKKLDKNPVDKILMNTRDRLAQINELQEQADLKVQEIASMADDMTMMAMGTGNKGVQSYAGGTGPGGIFSSGYDTGMFNDYLKNYMATNPGFNINDLEARKALQGTLGVTPDGIFGAQTLGALQSKFPMQAIPQTPMGGQMPTAQGLPASVPETTFEEPGMFDDLNLNPGSFTTGDMVGMAGTAFSGIMPLLNTKRNRATDTPNINAFEGFGEDALAANTQASEYLAGEREKAIADVDLRTNSSIRRNRNSARGVNQQRALDLTSDLQANEAIENIYSGFNNQMVNLFGQRSSLENQQDSAVMQGEAQRDIADRQDKDNYYTNLADNYANLGTAIQKIGSDFNKNQENNDFLDILPGTTANNIGMNRDAKGWYFIDANGNKEYLTKKKK